jgi:hypothetical protein
MHPRSPSAARLVRPATECAQCFKRIYMPDWSEYLDDTHVRHLWSCEACGYSFETLVVFRIDRRPAA